MTTDNEDALGLLLGDKIRHQARLTMAGSLLHGVMISMEVRLKAQGEEPEKWDQAKVLQHVRDCAVNALALADVLIEADEKFPAGSLLK